MSSTLCLGLQDTHCTHVLQRSDAVRVFQQREAEKNINYCYFICQRIWHDMRGRAALGPFMIHLPLCNYNNHVLQMRFMLVFYTYCDNRNCDSITIMLHIIIIYDYYYVQNTHTHKGHSYSNGRCSQS